MGGTYWRRKSDDSLYEQVRRTEDGVERVLAETDTPAIGYTQEGDGDSADVVMMRHGSLEQVETWKMNMKARLSVDRAMRKVLGDPRILSSTEWDINELNAAISSNGELWRLLRKAELL